MNRKMVEMVCGPAEPAEHQAPRGKERAARCNARRHHTVNGPLKGVAHRKTALHSAQHSQQHKASFLSP